MITVLILTEKLSMNEKVAASIIGGFSGGATIISLTEAEDTETIILDEKKNIDIFILQVNMKQKGGFKFAAWIREIKRYQGTPVLFITP